MVHVSVMSVCHHLFYAFLYIGHHAYLSAEQHSHAKELLYLDQYVTGSFLEMSLITI